MKTYKIFQVKTECFYQEVEAETLEEAIELSEYCDTELIPVDGTTTFEVDVETTKHFNECDSRGEPIE